VHTSFLQKLRPSARTFRALLPLYPSAIESFDLSSYDLVVSSSSAWAHAVICDESTVHVCYCYNPFRYAWNDRDRTLAERRDPVSRALLRSVFRRWRQWDWIAAQRVDRYVAISRTTQKRIASYFGRDSHIVHPPVDTSRFAPGPVGDHYLVLSELMPHKRIDTAVRAFNQLGLPLVVVGDGPDERRLRRLARPNVRFAGRVSDAEVAKLLSSSRALVVTAVEEFGIAGVEAQAAGRPVLAMDAGGLVETVIEGKTGHFWSGGPEALAEAVAGFDTSAVDPQACVDNAARFRLDAFRASLPREVAAAMASADDETRHERRAARASARTARRGLALRRP
jgi:glycosyltransferase involved in cell wall biosynthesis